jgi:hypothetical protein
METDDEKAKRLLTEQLNELKIVSGLNYGNPRFKAWRDTTRGYLERYLPADSPHLSTFKNLHFISPVITTERWGAAPKPPGYVSRADQEQFTESCLTAEATIQAVLKHIEEFGAHAGQAPAGPHSKSRRNEPHGGVSQNFYGNVTIQNQAIATDNAIQKIGRMGDTTGADLKEIAELFRQSDDLTPRQVREGLAGIEALAVEVQKPEAKRNWKSVLDCGQTVLSIADKATDLAHKIAPHTHSIVALVRSATHTLGLG